MRGPHRIQLTHLVTNPSKVLNRLWDSNFDKLSAGSSACLQGRRVRLQRVQAVNRVLIRP